MQSYCVYLAFWSGAEFLGQIARWVNTPATIISSWPSMELDSSGGSLFQYNVLWHQAVHYPQSTPDADANLKEPFGCNSYTSHDGPCAQSCANPKVSDGSSDSKLPFYRSGQTWASARLSQSIFRTQLGNLSILISMKSRMLIGKLNPTSWFSSSWCDFAVGAKPL